MGSKIVRIILLGLGGILLIPLLPFSVRIVSEYERGVIFRLGRLLGAKGPGLFILIPIVDRMQKIDLRTITLDVPSQEAITRDNVTVKVNAVIYFRVVEPTLAVVRILDYVRATSQIAQTTLRSVLGQSDLDELLGQREQINQRLQQIIDEQTEPWGVKVSAVEVKDVELPSTMQRAMARQAEAERRRRVPGERTAEGGGGGHGRGADHGAASLPADADRGCGGEQQHDRVPRPGGPDRDVHAGPRGRVVRRAGARRPGRARGIPAGAPR
jgi:regulator of protease activity HflC (stomatin/prohibitin superfamily)